MAGGKKPPEAETVSPKSCPICGKPAVPALTPFCSKRCADVDLHRWLGGVYVVPTDEPGAPDLPSDDGET